jgi:hypothetical protein
VVPVEGSLVVEQKGGQKAVYLIALPSWLELASGDLRCQSLVPGELPLFLLLSSLLAIE